ncbi:MAG: dephospho-CoA kinase, partial [Bacteroidia bacterium]|nr:dephospho-CoA kinase [Bacteroidia bacterium]
AELLQVYGIPVYDSDSRSKMLCETDPSLVLSLKTLFGNEVYLGDGRLNRSYMANAIFNDKALLQASNSLIHPAVGKDFATWVEKQNAPFVVQESAILFEAGLEKRYDFIICVTAPEELRLQRTCARTGLKPEDVLARMHNQLPEGERIRRSDFILVNDDRTPLIPQLEALMKNLA